MKTQQPEWKCIANLGDVHPINYGGYFVFVDTTGMYDYGGYFVFVDTTGVYPPEAEYLQSPEDDEGEWIAYRFILEPCTYQNGILSNNRSHPNRPAWFAEPYNPSRPQDGPDRMKGMAESHGTSEQEIISGFISDDPIKRAWSWRMVGEYWGFDELDYYPLVMNHKAAVERYSDDRYKIQPEADASVN